MAAPQGVRDIEVTSSPALSPPSVPSRISVVLVEEANSGDNDIWLLADGAKPASYIYIV